MLIFFAQRTPHLSLTEAQTGKTKSVHVSSGPKWWTDGPNYRQVANVFLGDVPLTCLKIYIHVITFKNKSIDLLTAIKLYYRCNALPSAFSKTATSHKLMKTIFSFRSPNWVSLGLKRQKYIFLIHNRTINHSVYL